MMDESTEKRSERQREHWDILIAEERAMQPKCDDVLNEGHLLIRERIKRLYPHYSENERKFQLILEAYGIELTTDYLEGLRKMLNVNKNVQRNDI